MARSPVDNKLAFSPAKRKAIAELGYGTNTKLMIGFETRYWQLDNTTADSQTDLGYQETEVAAALGMMKRAQLDARRRRRA